MKVSALVLLLAAVGETNQYKLSWGVHEKLDDAAQLHSKKDVQRDDELSSTMDSLGESQKQLGLQWKGGVSEDNLPVPKFERVSDATKKMRHNTAVFQQALVDEENEEEASTRESLAEAQKEEDLKDQAANAKK